MGKSYIGVAIAVIVVLALITSIAMGVKWFLPRTHGSSDTDAAKKVVDEYYGAIQAKDYDRALSFYSPEFFKKAPRKDWLEKLKQVNAKLGDYSKYEMPGENLHITATGIQFEIRDEFDCYVTYSKGSADETLVLVKTTPNAPFKIAEHKIDSPDLPKD